MFSYVFKKNRSSPTTSLNTKEVGERLTIGPAGRFCASQAPHLCLAAARMTLRLAPPRRNTRISVVSAMFRTRTFQFRLPGHPVLLRLLGDLHLHQVSELWLEKRRKLSPHHVCDCSMYALGAFLFMYLSCCPRSSYDTTHRFCWPSLG